MHPENVALRPAMEQSLPLIWFIGVRQGLYMPRYPVYLIAEERALQDMAGVTITVPAARSARPSRERPELRYREFLEAA